MAQDSTFTDLAVQFHHPSREHDRASLAASLLEIAEHLRATLREATGEPNLDFTVLEDLVPRFQQWHGLQVGDSYPLLTLRARVAKSAEPPPTTKLDQRSYTISEHMLGAPYGTLIKSFVCVFYGPRSTAFMILLRSDGVPQRLVPFIHSKQPEINEFYQTYGRAFHRVLNQITPDSQLALLFRNAIATFCALTNQPVPPPPAVEAETRAIPPRAAVVLSNEAYNYLESRIALRVADHPATPSAICIQGPPGCGKTLIAKAFVHATNAKLITHSMSAIHRASEARIGELFTVASTHPRAVILLEDADSLFFQRDGVNYDNASREAIDSLLSHWQNAVDENANITIIFTARDAMALDSAIVARIGAEILRIPLPDRTAREKIARIECEKRNIKLTIDHETTSGLSGRDIAAIIAATATEHATGADLATAFTTSLTRYRAQRSTETDKAQWQNLVLPPEIMSELKSYAQRWGHADDLSSIGFSIPKSLLLTGPPGTGKTHIARTLANELGMTFFAASAGELLGRYRGHSAIQIREFFARARASSPALIFLDEVDSLARTRGEGHSQVEALTQVLYEMDGIRNNVSRTYILAATNRPETLDPAILSRFGQALEIPLPDDACRERLFRLMLAQRPRDFDLEQYLPRLVKLSTGKSGRDIQMMVRQIEDSAIDRAITLSSAAQAKITAFDIEAALRVL